MPKKNKKILVVDDDVGTIRMVNTILGSLAYTLSSAEDGLDALVKIKEEKPDLVILDIMMPEINGYDVCYQLRFNKDFEQIPIILVTSQDNEIGEDVGKRLNIEFVQKPIDANLLVETVEKLLST